MHLTTGTLSGSIKQCTLVATLEKCSRFIYMIVLDTFNPFPQKKKNQEILDSSTELEEFADDNFKFDENGREFSKRVKNTVGKGEIARFPTAFSIDLYCRT